MNENQLSRLADELAALLEQYVKLQTEIVKAQARLAGREPETFDLYAVGGILHDVYRGAEGICRRIAKEFDQQLPMGESWHRLLLDQMTHPIPKARPPILQANTANALDEYRRFRHVVRNIYGLELNWPQMQPLLDNANPTIDAFAVDLQKFIAFLRMMSDSDASH